MDNRNIGIKRRVHDALVQRGFSRDWSTDRAVYRGVLDPTNLMVPVSIDVTDLDFVRPPPIRVEDSFHVTGRNLPHLLSGDRHFCYYAAGAVVLDRYNPGGTILQCLGQADDVMRKAVRGLSDMDFVEEFRSYWSSSFLLVDLPAEFRGKTKVRYLKIDPDAAPKAILCHEDSWLLDVHRANGGRTPDCEECEVILTDRALAVDPDGKWPPDTLSSLNRWLDWIEPSLVGRLERSFASGASLARYVALRAPNGTYLLVPFFRDYSRLKNSGGHGSQSYQRF